MAAIVWIIVLSLLGNVRTCTDLSSEKDCLFWKSNDMCDSSNPFYTYTKVNCQKTCNLCSVPAVTCEDSMGTVQCKDWRSFCKSPQYKSLMMRTCAKSCGYCTDGTTTAPTASPATGINQTTSTRPPRPGSRRPCGLKGLLSGRIVGGVESKPGEWPWQALVKRRDPGGVLEPICGGSLIDEEWVLSAAHCFLSTSGSSSFAIPSRFEVVLGDHVIDVEEGYETSYNLSKLILHPDFDYPTHDFDMALLKLSRPAQFNNRTGMVCLPNVSDITYTETQSCVITGWGALKEFGEKSNTLQQVVLPLVNKTECKSAFPHHTITDSMLCGGFKHGAVDACERDSGGPLVCRSTSGKWYQRAVISWGLGCALLNKYGVYSDLTVLLDWIEEVLGNN